MFQGGVAVGVRSAKVPQGGDVWSQDLLVTVWTEQQLELRVPRTLSGGLLPRRAAGLGWYKSRSLLPGPLSSVERLP